ncbi:MAG TPA: HD domain-containing protein [Desulfuromonadales bacterium]|nr:HD domain-containing protein [Desulfuromonadales bacterium]
MKSHTMPVLDFIRHLLSAVANAALYSMGHPQVERLSALAYTNLMSVLQARSEFTLMIVENELVIDGQAQELTLFLRRFTQIFTANSIGTMTIVPGVTKAELDALIRGIALQQESGQRVIDSSEHLRLGRVEVRLSSMDAGTSSSGTKPARVSLPDMPHEEMSRFMEMYETAKQQHKLKVNGIFDIVSGFIDVFRQEARPLLAMAALRDTDEYTFTHSTNVCVLNLAQAMALGIEGQLLNDIGVAAMLHDIGKLYIPEEILTKKGKLTDEEFDIMKQHPVKGARHLLDTPGVPRLAAIAAYEHHLKYNLRGYPRVADSWQQNLCSHMTAISDFFDALRTRRSYREPVELKEIATMMFGMMGTDLHPGLTKNFLRIIGRLMKTNPSAA